MNPNLIKLANLSVPKALIIGGALTFFWWYLNFDDGSALRTQLDQTEASIKTEEAKVAESEKALKEIEQVQLSFGTLSDQFKMVSQQLPTELSMAEIIRTVDKVSAATGLSVRSKVPRPALKKDVIETLPLGVTAVGTYSEVTNFFYYLSTIERIVRIQSITISAPNQIRRGSVLTVEATVASYRFVPPDPNAGAKK